MTRTVTISEMDIRVAHTGGRMQSVFLILYNHNKRHFEIGKIMEPVSKILNGNS